MSDKEVDLVVYQRDSGERVVIGKAVVKDDGTAEMTVTSQVFKDLAWPMVQECSISIQPVQANRQKHGYKIRNTPPLGVGEIIPPKLEFNEPRRDERIPKSRQRLINENGPDLNLTHHQAAIPESEEPMKLQGKIFLVGESGYEKKNLAEFMEEYEEVPPEKYVGRVEMPLEAADEIIEKYKDV